MNKTRWVALASLVLVETGAVRPLNQQHNHRRRREGQWWEIHSGGCM